MVGHCTHCGSTELIAGQDMYQCLICGKHTHSDGSLVAPWEDNAPLTTWFGRRNIDGGRYDSQE